MARYAHQFPYGFDFSEILRIKNIEDNQGETKVSEGVEGNYFDMLNYSVFALIHLEEGR